MESDKDFSMHIKKWVVVDNHSKQLNEKLRELRVVKNDLKKEIFKKISNKNDILEINYKGILVGDLLYDTYLKAKNKPTIDIKSDEFNIFSEEFLGLCEFWIEYFKENKIKAIIAFHSVYSYAIPLRIAIHNNIDAFG